MLLEDTQGFTLDNVGKNFNDSCEKELRDFVENFPLCPNLLKEEFKESQKEAINVKQDEDPFVFGDLLYIDPEGNPERAQKDDFMHLRELANDEDTEIDLDTLEDKYEHSDPNYCENHVDPKHFNRITPGLGRI